MSTVLYEVRDHIAYVTLNRPDALNAINRELGGALEDTWHRYNADDDAWVAILTANGRAFCSGADLRDRAGDGEDADRPRLSLGHGIDVYKPIVVGVHGYCLAAGIDLVLPCDIRVAAEDASFGMTMTRWGVMASTGASQLPRSIQWAHAMEMLLTAERIDAQEAYRIGLVNRVVPNDDLLAACEDYASKILRNSPTAVRLTKEAAIRGRDSSTMAESLKLGFSLQRVMRTTPDAQEGPRAFVEKRQPEWQPSDVGGVH
jgi:enoyl-CoA hydratase/carnithine racemase